MNTERDYLKWVAAGCALVATASAEYAIARACHFPEWVAWTVPGALDAYVLRALRAHREVLTAVLAMVGVNAASHLVTAGVLHVGWQLITAVSAIAPLVLWRVHTLSTPGEWRARKIWDVPRASTPDEHGRTGDVSTPQTCSVRGCSVWGDLGAHERAHGLAGWDEHADAAVTVAMPDYVPRDWSTPSTGNPGPGTVLASTPEWDGTVTGGNGCPYCTTSKNPDLRDHVRNVHWDRYAEWDGTVTVLAPGTQDEHDPIVRAHERARVLSIVPPLPDGYVSAVLMPGDMEHMNQARVLDSQARAQGTEHGVTVRVLKTRLSVGTPRAQRIKAALDAEHTARTADTDRSTT